MVGKIEVQGCDTIMTDKFGETEHYIAKTGVDTITQN